MPDRDLIVRLIAVCEEEVRKPFQSGVGVQIANSDLERATKFAVLAEEFRRQLSELIM
jgi:hypothetical protein